MPAFTFEKISPATGRGPTAATPKKPRGVISQAIDRFADRRAKREQREAVRRDEKPAK